MKKKLLIFVIMTFCSLAIFPELSAIRAEEETEVATTSNELPSNTYLRNERRSIASSYDGSMVATKQSLRSGGWGDPTKPGDDDGWEESNAGNVGGPIGNASLPIIISLVLLYFGYRRVTTSRRKNDF